MRAFLASDMINNTFCWTFWSAEYKKRNKPPGTRLGSEQSRRQLQFKRWLQVNLRMTNFLQLPHSAAAYEIRHFLLCHVLPCEFSVHLHMVAITTGFCVNVPAHKVVFLHFYRMINWTFFTQPVKNVRRLCFLDHMLLLYLHSDISLSFYFLFCGISESCLLPQQLPRLVWTSVNERGDCWSCRPAAV